MGRRHLPQPKETERRKEKGGEGGTSGKGRRNGLDFAEKLCMDDVLPVLGILGKEWNRSTHSRTLQRCAGVLAREIRQGK